MRTVLRNSAQVFHYWANQVQLEGRAGNVSFFGAKLYSYAAQIGEIIEHEGTTYAVFTRQAWSSTTSKHQFQARHAADHHHCITIADFNAISYRLREITEKEAVVAALRAKRARTEVGARRHLGNATWIIRDYNTYLTITGYDLEPLSDVSEEDVAAVEEEDKRQRQAQRQREAERKKEMVERIADWRRGCHINLPWGLSAMLRLNQGRQVIETSKGAEIPVDAALRLWPVIQRVRDGDRDYDIGMELGSYRLTKIRREGSILVGCHDIAYAEIELMAAALGLAEEVTA